MHRPQLAHQVFQSVVAQKMRKEETVFGMTRTVWIIQVVAVAAGEASKLIQQSHRLGGAQLATLKGALSHSGGGVVSGRTGELLLPGCGHR